MAKIMLLDDEDDLREEVSSFLKITGGFDVTQVCTIRQFHQHFDANTFDIVILDAMLPDGDGFSVAEEVSRDHPHCGVVMFTARDSTRDRIYGYGMGVDHYVTKPIRMEELLAVLQSLTRRVCLPKVWKLSQAEWNLQSPTGTHIALSGMEYKFLFILNAKNGSAVSRRHIIEQLGKDRASYDDRNLDALVLRLRRKVRSLTAEDFPLKTIHGSGYTLSQPFSDG
jgi:DNA-binding response OmpR family regulator